MPSWRPLGKHEISIDEDAMHWKLRGDVDLDEMKLLLIETEAILQRCSYVLMLVDCRASGTLSREARRFNAQWFAERAPHCGKTALFGLGVMTRAMLQLVLRATQFLAKRTHDTTVVESEAAALEWLAAHRRLLRPQPTGAGA